MVYLERLGIYMYAFSQILVYSALIAVCIAVISALAGSPQALLVIAVIVLLFFVFSR